MNSLKEKIARLRTDFKNKLTLIASIDQLELLRITYLGRNGALADLVKIFKTISLEQKKELGPLINLLKQETEQLFSAKKAALAHEQLNERLTHDKFFDVTAYINEPITGTLHPLTLILKEIEDICVSMGFTIARGPEIETEYYNFEALNISKDHPARDMWDTFYVDIPGLLLRTHTSSVQIHAMQQEQPPIAIVAPGRCYRHEATDASHDFMFMQLEGCFIDKNISMGNLLATVQTLLQAVFTKEDLGIRVRPSYFPFVEPGIEIDMSCPFCQRGCSVCKQTRWIEICGAGLIHPHVLNSSNINPDIYSGFAFGFGLTRLAMLKYGINDIRLLHTGAVEFLKQF